MDVTASNPPPALSPSVMSTPSPTASLVLPSAIPESAAPGEEELPLTTAASVVLTALPRNGQRALDAAAHPRPRKVSVRFQAIGSAPMLNTKVYKIKTTQRFESVVVFLRRELGVRDADGLHTYVNSSFAPAGDEGVGSLWECFKIDDCLIVSYCMTPAFG